MEVKLRSACLHKGALGSDIQVIQIDSSKFISGLKIILWCHYSGSATSQAMKTIEVRGLWFVLLSMPRGEFIYTRETLALGREKVARDEDDLQASCIPIDLYSD